MILFKVDGEKCKEVKVKIECENEDSLIVELTSLLLCIGRDDKLRIPFLKAADVAILMIKEEE